jgi:hypothetical protein
MEMKCISEMENCPRISIFLLKDFRELILPNVAAYQHTVMPVSPIYQDKICWILDSESTGGIKDEHHCQDGKLVRG